jgi:hypothetical protein
MLGTISVLLGFGMVIRLPIQWFQTRIVLSNLQRAVPGKEKLSQAAPIAVLAGI